MTREELKRHCLKQIEGCEMWTRHNREKPHGKVYEEHKLILELLEQESCEDAISRKSIKQKLQDHHDFFVNAYGGFSNLPLNDKSRVDEITNCIAMVVNEPPVTPQPKTGHWIPVRVRLPESNGVYIVTREFTDGFECVDLTDACYFDGTSTWHDDNRINHGREYVDKKIKAWMPLPEPYKAESEEE